MAKRKVFGISKDLDDGISQTIKAAKNNMGQLRYEVIPLVKIKFDPDNPRKLTIAPQELKEDLLSVTDPLYERKKKELESLKSLASSIKKTGVRNAIEVYKDGIDYRLISGERRVLGSILAGKEDIQARVIDVKPTEFDIRYLQWIENIEREDLTLWERVLNVRQLITAYKDNEQMDVTATILRDILGCSLPHAMTYMAVLNAPSDLEIALQNNQISNLEKAAVLAKLTDAQLRTKLINICIENNVSLSGLKKLIIDNDKVTTILKKKSVQKPGRQAKRVTLGYTSKVSVAKQLIESVVSKSQYANYADTFKNIDWADCTSVSKAFQNLIKLMETID